MVESEISVRKGMSVKEWENLAMEGVLVEEERVHIEERRGRNEGVEEKRGLLESIIVVGEDNTAEI